MYTRSLVNIEWNRHCASNDTEMILGGRFYRRTKENREYDLPYCTPSVKAVPANRIEDFCYYFASRKKGYFLRYYTASVK